ncbi:helix-turn-helix transcriptional regulator [Allofournierella sp.]|uniref:helix-turn-helix transcriptional regulator n=1 Tax=Allofournierella sp. TaxID=1940256 RepID=UPI003AB46F59
MNSPIKAAREAAGLTVRELAAVAKINKNTLCAIETGKTIPRADTLRRIADGLGKTLDELWP